MTRQINDAGLELIKNFEGLKLDAYQDVAGIWTVGYGHTKNVHPGMHVTVEQATQLLRDDLAEFESAVDNGTMHSPTSDNQFSAMVALCFNIGSANFRGSTVLRDHNAGKCDLAAEAFLMWNKARINGALQPVAGLTNRRRAERDLYLQAAPKGRVRSAPIW